MPLFNHKYATWVAAYDSLLPADRQAILKHISGFFQSPRLSVIILPCDNPTYVSASIISVQKQLYTNWELIVVGDSNGKDTVTYTNTLEEAIQKSSGDFITLLAAGDQLSPTAFYMAAYVLNAHPQLEVIYSDEDMLDDKGNRQLPWFKGAWNIDLLYAQDYISRLALYRLSALRSVFGRCTYPTVDKTLYALSLHLTAKITKDHILHIPFILYHKKENYFSGHYQVLKDFMDTHHPKKLVSYSSNEAVHIIHPLPAHLPSITIIIPTKDNAYYLRHAVNSILALTDYPNYQVLIIDHESTNPHILQLFALWGSESKIRIIPYNGEFNFSAINNFAVSHCQSDLVCFMNDDTEVITSDWLREMISHAIRPDIGVVGCKLLFANGELQHAGVILGVSAIASHYFYRLGTNRKSYHNRENLAQEVSAVTAACMVIRRELFQKIGGFDAEQLAVTFNDVDLCLRLKKHGYRIIYTPFAILYHAESSSRGADSSPAKQQRFAKEVAIMKKRWVSLIHNDPFYSLNLNLHKGDFTPAFPPRLGKPWLKNALRPAFPIIVIGMHRSGTSLIASIMQQLGIFIGNQLDPNNEALFFLRNNEWLLHQHQATWDNIAPFQQILASNPELIRHYASLMYERIQQDMMYRKLLTTTTAWGWKDPRNSVTLPIWAEVFPACRVINIERHGVDVAESLRKRGSTGVIRNTTRCSTLEGGFSLWEEYLISSAHNIKTLQLPFLTLKFEELLIHPHQSIKKLADFCGVTINNATIEHISGNINKEKAFAYKQEQELQDFSQKKML